jgi:hypothetical protein
MRGARPPDESQMARVNSIRVETGECQRRADMERAMVFRAAASRILWVHDTSEEELAGVEG